jgi:hypothetical protein
MAADGGSALAIAFWRNAVRCAVLAPVALSDAPAARSAICSGVSCC